MADLADEAQRWEEAERLQALARLRPAPRAGTASALACDGCDDEIPHARRQALPGVRLCTACAAVIERHGRLRER